MSSPPAPSLRATRQSCSLQALSVQNERVVLSDERRTNVEPTLTCCCFASQLVGLFARANFLYVEIYVNIIPTFLTVSITSTRAFKYNNYKYQSN